MSKGLSFSGKIDFWDLADAMKDESAARSYASSNDDPPAKFLDDLYEWLEQDYEQLVHDPRSPGLHASSLYKVCSRREIISALFNDYNKPYPQTAGNKFTQDLGHAMHQWWQERYLGPQGVLIGDWHCIACDTVTSGKMPLDCPCGADWRDAVRYKELGVKIDDLGISGHCDGILLDPATNVKRVFEFKTKSTFQYRSIHAPTYDHVVQTHAYMYGLGLKQTIIVYIDKGKPCSWRFNKGNFKAGKPNVKAFLIKFDKNLWSQIVDVVKSYHNAIKIIESGELENIKNDEESDKIVSEFGRVCESPTCNLAKSCHVVEKCFSMPPVDEVIEV